MRLSFITLFISFLSLSVGAATNPHFLSRNDPKRPPVPSAISSRQYHLPRSLLDLCININVNLFADVGRLLDLESILGPLDLLSKVHLCLCLKDLDIYLATNSEIQSLIYLLGPNIVSSRIRAIINTSPHAQECTFPQHAHHTCTTKDPCHWACDENYVLDGDKCVCAPPFVSCNGICDLFPKGCSSALSRTLNIRTHSVSTLSQAKTSCKFQETVCGIAGREDSLAFECINTTVAKDSCGGCMVPHPFSEVDPLHEASGQDCTEIPNVRSVGCSHSRCVVTSCQEGWFPNANNTGCIVDLAEDFGRVSKRLDINATTNIVVDSEILTKVVAVVDAVLHLSIPPSASGANVTTTISYGVSLLNDVNTAAANLVTSHTIRVFLQSIDHLLDVCSLLKSWMSSCACVRRLGLSELVEEMDSLVAVVAELQTFCSSHPVVSGPESPTALSPATGDRPLVIRPSDLLSRLQLNGKIVVGLHDTSLLSVLGLGGHRSSINTDSDLLDKIAALVHFVINLQDDLTALPLVGHPTPVDVDLLVSIGQVTKNLLNATTVSDVIEPLGQLVTLSNASIQILEACGCIDSFGLQQLHSNLRHILDVVLGGLTWCQRHPVVPGSNTPLAISELGLSDRLNLVTLDSLGSIKATATLGGLGGSLSNTANGLLDSLGIDPHNVKRDVVVKSKARDLVDPNLLSCLEVLVNLVANLRVSIALTLSTSQPCVGPAELALVKEMIDSLTCITPSTTLAAILISVNQILMAESSLEQALQTCPDAGTVQDLVELLVKITKVTLRLGDLCGSSKTTPVHRSTVSPLPTASRSVRIVTSRPPSPTSTTPFSVIVERPTATTLPIAVPTGPTLSDDEIIVSLNHLLTTLGLGGIKGVVTVDGLGHELNDPVNRLLDGLQVGPHDLRRRENHQLIVQGRPIHLTLQANVDALVDLFITLVGECGPMNCTNLGTTLQGDILEASLQQMVGILTATSWSKLVGGLDHLTTTSMDALKLLNNCKCIAERKLGEVHRYMTGVVNVSLALQRLCRRMDMSGTVVGGVNGQPMVMGLARLLKALGIKKRSAVVLNGIGGGELSRQ